MKLPIEISIDEEIVNNAMLEYVKSAVQKEINDYRFGVMLKSHVTSAFQAHIGTLIKKEMEDSDRLKAEVIEAIKKELHRQVKAAIKLDTTA